MKNIYCAGLSLPFSFDLQELVKKQPKSNPSTFGHWAIQPHHDLEKFLLNFGIGLSLCELFYSPPGARQPVHVDGSNYSNRCKINWRIDALGSVMNWWQVKNSNYSPICLTTSLGGSYLLADKSQYEIVWSDQLLLPSLVNVGVMHNIINYTDQARWCMSYNLVNLDTNESLQWSDAIDKLQTILITGAVL